jgi:hypothetical protein
MLNIEQFIRSFLLVVLVDKDTHGAKGNWEAIG